MIIDFSMDRSFQIDVITELLFDLEREWKTRAHNGEERIQMDKGYKVIVSWLQKVVAMLDNAVLSEEERQVTVNALDARLKYIALST